MWVFFFFGTGVTASGGDGLKGGNGGPGGDIELVYTPGLQSLALTSVSASGGDGGQGWLGATVTDLDAAFPNGGHGGRAGKIQATVAGSQITAYAVGGKGGNGAAGLSATDDKAVFAGIDGFSGGNGGNGGCIQLTASTATAVAIGGGGGKGGAGGWSGTGSVQSQSLDNLAVQKGGRGGRGGDAGTEGNVLPITARSTHPFFNQPINGGEGGKGGVGGRLTVRGEGTRGLDGGDGGDGGTGSDSNAVPGKGGKGGEGGPPGFSTASFPSAQKGTNGAQGQDGQAIQPAGGQDCDCPKLLVFIPGIAASDLSTDKEKVWVAFLPKTLSQLDLAPDQGTPPLIHPHDILRSVPLVGEIYGQFVRFLENSGYIEHQTVGHHELRSLAGMRSDPTLANSPKGKPNFFPFSYDWRQSNRDSARKLADYVAGISALHPGCRIDFVAHSMGGLVLRQYLVDSGAATQRGNVGRVVTIGTPVLGAPLAIFRMLRGYFYGVGLLDFFNNPTMIDILQDFPGFFELMPSPLYDALAAQAALSPLFEAGVDLDENGLTADPLSLYSIPPATKLPPRLLQAAAAGAAFHAGPLDDWSSDSADLEVLHVVGRQSGPKTPIQVKAFPVWLDDTYYGVGYGTLPGYGDETVPVLSAVREPGYLSPNARIFLAQGQGPFAPLGLSDSDVEHTQLMSNPIVQNVVLRFLNGGHAAVGPLPPLSGRTLLNPTAGLLPKAVRVVRMAGLPPRPAGALHFAVGENSLYQAEVFMPLEGRNTVVITNVFQGLRIDVFEIASNTVVRSISFKTGAASPDSVRISSNGESLVVNEILPDAAGLRTNTLAPFQIIESPAASDTAPPVLRFEQELSFIEIIADDSGSGVESIFFSLDGAAFSPYSSPIPYSTQANLSAYAVDRVGNRSAPVSLQPPAVDKPLLSWTLSPGGELLLRWSGANYILQETASITAWHDSNRTVSQNENTNEVLVPIRATHLFFRLRK